MLLTYVLKKKNRRHSFVCCQTPVFPGRKGEGLKFSDEPTGNLDTAASHDVIGLLRVAAKQFQQTVILITHDNDIAQMADRTVRIEDGRIVNYRNVDGGIKADRHMNGGIMNCGSILHPEKAGDGYAWK